MRILSYFWLGLALSAFVPAATQQAPRVPGDIIIQMKENATLEHFLYDQKQLNGKETHFTLKRELSSLVNIQLCSFDTVNIDEWEMLAAIRNHPAVQLAQFNHYLEERAVPSDPEFGSQWHHVNPTDKDIDSDLAWNITTGGSTFSDGHDIVVCVIEPNGADYNHPDLIANHWTNTGEIPGNGIDDDGNGYVDDVNGWNTLTLDDNISPGGHGTAVSGMIGASANNGVGGVGVNWNVKIMQVENAASVTEANTIAAYAYPHTMRNLWNSTGGAQGAFVVATNASWGIDYADPANYPVWCAYYNALGTSGILNCAATTNNDENIDVVGDMPTGCSSLYLISVTASNSSDLRTFAGYGTVGVDLAAPGSNVWLPTAGGGYNYTSGTSFASPCTAGAVALLYSAPCADLADDAMNNPQGTADLVRNSIFDGVDMVANLIPEVATGGRLNVNNSLNLLIGACGGGCEQWWIPDLANGASGPALWTCSGPFGYLIADQSCAQDVIDANPNCVTVAWDVACQTEYDCCADPSIYIPDLAVGFSGPPIEACDPPLGYILPDQGCLSYTISLNAACNTVWDANCQAEYECCLDPPWFIPDLAAGFSGAPYRNWTCIPPEGYLMPDQDCVQSVIDNDPFCLDTSWDQICQNAYDCCVETPWYIPDLDGGFSGPPLNTCDPPLGYILADTECVVDVISTDPWCTVTGWDSTCQWFYNCCLDPYWYIPDLANGVSGPAMATCDPPLGYIYAANQACVQSVVDQDAYCINNSWDALCQDAYECCQNPPWYIPDLENSASGPPIQSCEPPMGYLLADSDCIESIIANDPFCLSNGWDWICQTAYDCCVTPFWYIPNPSFGTTGPAIQTCDPPFGYMLVDQECALEVIDGDDYCQNFLWDPICQEAYDCCINLAWYIPDLTLGTSGVAVRACSAPAGYILADQICVQSVIDNDPFCIDVIWDNVCQAAYACCLNPSTSGCINDDACNYNALACNDDGSCLYPGCTNSNACNYDPLACSDDGSCQMGYWWLPNTYGGGLPLWQCDQPADYYFADQDCVQSVVNDDANCGDEEWDLTCQLTYSCCVDPSTIGCIDPNACNYFPSACTPNNSLCTFGGCTNPDACNFDSSAGCDDGSCILPLWYIPNVIGSGPAMKSCTPILGYTLANQECAEWAVAWNPLCWLETWDEICQSGYNCCLEIYGCDDQNACNYDPGYVCHVPNMCVYPGCTDSAACNYDSTAGCDDGSCDFGGCNDPTACNYDSNTLCDDGSCILPLWYIPQVVGSGPAVYSCVPVAGYILAEQECAEAVVLLDPFCEYDTWDSICQEGYNCCLDNYGCNDETACNFDPNFPCPSPNMCVYPGCTDSAACNYDPAAGCDDGSCLPGGGCMDTLACNYDSSASCDNGLCDYSCLCPYDLDGSGSIDTADLLLLLTEYGCAGNCSFDLTGDDAVDTADLLEFLTGFGTSCQ